MDVEPADVALLVADRYPAWAGLPVRRVPSSGTVNALFRVGDEVALRLPLHPDPDPATVERIRAAQAVTARIPTAVALPGLLGVAAPHPRYPGWSSAYRWIDGEPIDPDAVPDRLADDLAAFVRAVRALPLDGPLLRHPWRSGPLVAVDEEVREAIAACRPFVPVPPLEAVWVDALAAPLAPSCWIHTDLMPGNLLVRDGGLAAVLDCEDVAVGDPAVDLLPAWNLLDPPARARFRAALRVDDDAWRRGRGWALAQAALALPYYAETNRHMADTARRTLAALVQD